MKRPFQSVAVLLSAARLTACSGLATTPLPTVMPTPPPANTPAPTATLPPTRTVTPAATAVRSEPDQLRHVPAPSGRWTSVVNDTAGSLDLQSAAGETHAVFPVGSTVGTVSWSPDGHRLLVVCTHRRLSPSGLAIQMDGPVEIWQIRLEEDQPVTLMIGSEA